MGEGAIKRRGSEKETGRGRRRTRGMQEKQQLECTECMFKVAAGMH